MYQLINSMLGVMNSMQAIASPTQEFVSAIHEWTIPTKDIYYKSLQSISSTYLYVWVIQFSM